MWSCICSCRVFPPAKHCLGRFRVFHLFKGSKEKHRSGLFCFYTSWYIFQCVYLSIFDKQKRNVAETCEILVDWLGDLRRTVLFALAFVEKTKEKKKGLTGLCIVLEKNLIFGKGVFFVSVVVGC